MIKKDISQLHLPERFVRKLKQDVAYLLGYPNIEIEQIILFGSCARGNYKVTSDIDLLMITKESLERYIRGDISSELEEEVEQVSTDIVFYSNKIFQEADSLFIKQVKQDGIIIYDQKDKSIGGDYAAK
nr:nucleotidyltransferase domain-containing protein [uncultured Niameybacter sp.]